MVTEAMPVQVRVWEPRVDGTPRWELTIDAELEPAHDDLGREERVEIGFLAANDMLDAWVAQEPTRRKWTIANTDLDGGSPIVIATWDWVAGLQLSEWELVDPEQDRWALDHFPFILRHEIVREIAEAPVEVEP